MAFRSTDTKGRSTVPANAALVGFRIVPGMAVADALEAYALAETTNDLAAAARRHPSWNPALENDPRYQPDPEWTNEEIRFARAVLLRALRVYGPHAESGFTHLRQDGRWEVADHGAASHLYCPLDDWCILEVGHPGLCNEDREAWFGPDVLYPTGALAHA